MSILKIKDQNNNWQSIPAMKGDPGVSPAVTVETIQGGHQVTITDATHPQGQSFNVMDGQGSGISDAPSDGKAYVRKDGIWSEGVEKGEFDEMLSGEEIVTPELELTNGFINYYGGAINSAESATYKHTNRIQIQSGDVVTVSLVASQYMIAIAFYDTLSAQNATAAKSVRGVNTSNNDTVSADYEYTASADCVIAFSGRAESQFNVRIKKNSGGKNRLDKIEDSIELNDAKIDDLTSQITYKPEIPLSVDGKKIQYGGQVVADANYMVSEEIEVNEGDTIMVRTSATASIGIIGSNKNANNLYTSVVYGKGDDSVWVEKTFTGYTHAIVCVKKGTYEAYVKRGNIITSLANSTERLETAESKSVEDAICQIKKNWEGVK